MYSENPMDLATCRARRDNRPGPGFDRPVRAAVRME